MKSLLTFLTVLCICIPSIDAQQCGNTAAGTSAAWDFYEDNVPNANKVIALTKLLDDIVEVYNKFPNNGPGRAGYRGLNIPTHQPQTGTTVGIGARLWLTPPSQEPHVEVTIKKTGGKAKTNIDICITGKNRIQEYVKSYTFEKDAPNHSKTFVLKKVKDHIISIRVNPNFGTNIFKYEISTSSQKAHESNTESTSASSHPSGLEGGGAVSIAGDGDGSGVRDMNPHPGNITRGPEEHEIGGTYTMTMTNGNNNIVSTGSAIVNPDETPWLLTLVPDNSDVRFIKYRGEFRNNTFRGMMEDDPSKKFNLKFNPTTKVFNGKMKELLPNATYKTVKIKLVKT